MFLSLLLIQVIVVIIVDLSGINDTWKSLLKIIATKGRMRNPNYEGFDLCDFCINWWIGLLYLILTGNLTLLCICVVLLLSFFTNITKEVLIRVNDILVKIIWWKFGKKS